MENIPLITSTDVERYQQLRAQSRQIVSRIVKTIPRAAIQEIGKALGIEHKGTLVLETEDVSSVLMDCCLHDWIEQGKNLVQKYVEGHPSDPQTDEHFLLQAYCKARFRILHPTATLPGAGVYCVDALSGMTLFLMDVAFSQSLEIGQLLLATRTILLGGYWMTSGAALPIDRTTAEVVIRRLRQGKLLEDGGPGGEHELALEVLRACLDCGAAEQIRYEGPNEEDEQLELAAPRQQVRTSRRIASRNDPCPCGSGKKYKRCCMGK